MATPTRIYLITIGDKKRLVRAAHPASALMFVARDIAAVSVATQNDLIDSLAQGIKVESAKDEAESQAAA
jgi:hypothetical protein